MRWVAVVELASSLRKTSVLSRVVAKLIDLAIVITVSAIIPYPIGPVAGFFYSLFADGITGKGFKGQSVGKRLLGLEVVQRETGKTASYKDSALRNAPIGVATFFAIIPVWGWVLLVLVGIPLMAIEVYLMVRVENGQRLGDVMGDTEVRPVSEVASGAA